MRCTAERAGLEGCQAPVTWVIKAARSKIYSCGRHLNRQCLAMLRTGAEFMTVTIHA